MHPKKRRLVAIARVMCSPRLQSGCWRANWPVREKVTRKKTMSQE
jgi:hypothetical protein